MPPRRSMQRYRVSADGPMGASASVHLWAYDDRHAIFVFHRVHGKVIAQWGWGNITAVCFDDHDLGGPQRLMDFADLAEGR